MPRNIKQKNSKGRASSHASIQAAVRPSTSQAASFSSSTTQPTGISAADPVVNPSLA